MVDYLTSFIHQKKIVLYFIEHLISQQRTKLVLTSYFLYTTQPILSLHLFVNSAHEHGEVNEAVRVSLYFMSSRLTSGIDMVNNERQTT